MFQSLALITVPSDCTVDTLGTAALAAAGPGIISTVTLSIILMFIGIAVGVVMRRGRGIAHKR